MVSHPQIPNWYTVFEVADLSGRSVHTIYNRIKSGKLRAYRLRRNGGAYVIASDDLIQFMQNEEEPTRWRR